MFFKNFKVWETELAGRKLTLETGKMAGLANASVMARYGETNVLCTVTASAKPREGVDFFPLSVDYEEKMYSVGKIPGSFQRREGRASEKAILTSRCIDRPIRPLFPKDLRNDCSVVATVMSVDPDCSPEITAMIGVSAAIAISDIPWDGPISGVNVGLVDGQIVINPTLEQRAKSDLVLTVASTADLVAMIEAGGNEIDDDTMFDAIMAGHEENKKIVKFIQGIVDEIGKPKFEYESSNPDPEIMAQIEEFCIEDVKKALDTDDKLVRDEALLPIYAAVHEKFDEQFEGNETKIDEIMYLVQKHVVRSWLKDEHKRVDGRGIDEIRPLNAEVDLLARAHGSGLFTRGQTQVLSVTTLGPMSDAQQLDGLDEQTDISTTTTSRHTLSAKQSRQEDRAEEKSATVHWQKRHLFPFFRLLTSSRMQFALYRKFFHQTAQHHKVQSAAQPFLLWQQAFRLRHRLQVFPAVLSPATRVFTATL